MPQFLELSINRLTITFYNIVPLFTQYPIKGPKRVKAASNNNQQAERWLVLLPAKQQQRYCVIMQHNSNN